jgi:hypothetical protein
VVDLVVDEFGNSAVHGKDIVDGWGGGGGERAEEGEKAGLLGGDGEPGAEVVAKCVGIVERKGLKSGIKQEVEGIDGFEVGDEIYLYREL